MEKKLFKLDSITQPVKAEVDQTTTKLNLTVSLPIMIKALVICDDEQVDHGINELLKGVRNLQLQVEHKLTFITQDYQLALVVFTGDEAQTIINVEKISHAGTNIILIGDNLPQRLLRKSLQLSIKDFVPLDTAEVELLPAIQNLANYLSSQADVAPVISIINGKGGSGASFITNSLGQVISSHCKEEIALLDADLHYGSLADSLNFSPEYFLDDALEDVKDLDSTAIKSMMSSRENLSLLPIKAYSQLNRLTHIDQNRLNQLLAKLRLDYQLFIADLSRGLDSLSIPIVESSEHIVIVVQQNIVSIRETKALVEQLKNIMGIPVDKLHLVVNRYSDKFSTITLSDIQKTIGIESAFKISNDYQLASACTDLGKSIEEIENSKHIEQELTKIIEHIIPLKIKFIHKPKSLWARIKGEK